MEENFVLAMGYVLGLLVVLVVSGIFLKPARVVLSLVTNSILGGAIILIINLAGKGLGIHIGLNPLTAIGVGVLGMPGAIALLLLQIIY